MFACVQSPGPRGNSLRHWCWRFPPCSILAGGVFMCKNQFFNRADFRGIDCCLLHPPFPDPLPPPCRHWDERNTHLHCMNLIFVHVFLWKSGNIFSPVIATTFGTEALRGRFALVSWRWKCCEPWESTSPYCLLQVMKRHRHAGKWANW